MKKLRLKRFIPALLVLLMGGYLAFALIFTSRMAAADVCSGVEFHISSTSSAPFVTETELNRDLGNITERAPGTLLSEIDTYALRQRLLAIDKIETARVLTLSSGKILIDVVPMKPVARVFDGDRSYYINKDGKRMTANARYHMDVPIIIGRLDAMNLPADSLLPLIDYISAHPVWEAFVSAIKVDSPADVLLLPNIRGHVVNIGEANAFDDKFNRLHKFYTHVPGHMGWSRYDTISVKWRGQVVATRANKGINTMPDIREDIDEADDAITMLPTDDALPKPKPQATPKDSIR